MKLTCFFFMFLFGLVHTFCVSSIHLLKAYEPIYFTQINSILSKIFLIGNVLRRSLSEHLRQFYYRPKHLPIVSLSQSHTFEICFLLAPLPTYIKSGVFS